MDAIGKVGESRSDPPAVYTPWTKGVYEVAPGLRPFGTDFGNGEADQRVFQLDSEYARYRANKIDAIGERRSKYVCREDLSEEVEAAAVGLIRRLLPSSEACGLDDLAMSVQEDIVLVSTEGDCDWVSYLHLCSPSHWAAEAKVGRSFFDVHAPIPGFDRINSVSRELVEAMVRKGPFVRFVWGVESDDRLNHHPEPPPGHDPGEWHGRQFSKGRFFVRTERQVIWGLPEVGAAMFTIRVGHVPDTVVLARPHLRDSLRSAVESMSPAARAYKGLDREWGALIDLLEDAQARGHLLDDRMPPTDAT